jgi:hypothetical protein
VNGAPDPAALNALYPSANKPDATAATPGSTTTKAAAASPATSPASAAPKATMGAPKPAAASPASASPGTAPQPGKGAWQAPSAASPGTAATAAPGTTAQPETKAAEPASLYVEPIKTMEEAVAATPIPEGDAANFDQGEEGRQARAEIRSAFIAAGASKEETAELWGIAVAAARPDARITTADEAERELREAWKVNYEVRLASVRAFFKGVAQKHPVVADEVRKLGLDNSAAFLKALHRASARRGR